MSRSKRRKLHPAIITAIFLVSAAIATGSSLTAIDIGIWLGIDDTNIVLPAALAYIVIFVIWVAVFFILMWLVERFGFEA